MLSLHLYVQGMHLPSVALIMSGSLTGRGLVVLHCGRCQKAAKLQCPKCLELGLPKQPSAFCSQDCFKVPFVRLPSPAPGSLHATQHAVTAHGDAFGMTSRWIASTECLGGAQACAQGGAAHVGVCCAAGQRPEVHHAALQLDRHAAANHGFTPARGGHFPLASQRG